MDTGGGADRDARGDAPSDGATLLEGSFGDGTTEGGEDTSDGGADRDARGDGPSDGAADREGGDEGTAEGGEDGATEGATDFDGGSDGAPEGADDGTDEDVGDSDGLGVGSGERLGFDNFGELLGGTDPVGLVALFGHTGTPCPHPGDPKGQQGRGELLR